MKIILVGLGKMGEQIANRFLKNKFEVIVLDPNPEAVQRVVKNGGQAGQSREKSLENFKDGENPIVWLMIPAKFVNDEVKAWVDILPKESILIDGGNTDFRDSINHAKIADSKRIHFLDVGVSGGILGTKNGFSMMAGGDEKSYEKIKSVLETLASPRGGYEYFGEPGSGHYVKMVHNAIEYGMMESLVEGYRMLKDGYYQGLDLAKAGKVWQEASVIESTLNSLAAEVMHENPNLNDISGVVAESGEARWTLEIAKDKNIKLPSIDSAFEVRLDSQKGQVNFATKFLAALRNKFGGHNIQGKQ